jgi:transposase
MRPPTPIPENRIVELEDFRKDKWPGFEFQRFLCVWLRVMKKMSTSDIAKAIGWNVNTVRVTQKDFIERGVAALTELRRGGRRHAFMSLGEEKEFLSAFEEESAKGHVLVANKIKAALEQRLGHNVHKTTVYRMLHRNGWRKIVPKPSHPKRDKEAGEAFKKGASAKE